MILSKRIINSKKIIVWFCLLLIILFTFYKSKFGTYVEDNIAYKILFVAREALNSAPKLNPKIKIYAFDDHSVDKLNIVDIPLKIWAKLIEKLSLSNPKMIVIDKKFGMINHDDGLQELRQTLSNSAPVYVGSYTKNKLLNPNIFNESKLNLNRNEFQIKKYSEPENLDLSWIKVLNHDSYGPHKDIENSFHHIGHINYDFIGRVSPFRRISDSHIIPHLTLLTAQKLKILEKGIEVNDLKVPLDSNGLIPVNFPSKKELYSNTKSLLPIIKLSNSSKPLRSISKDDIIVILPLFYTGNADMGETPIGILPRGYIISSIINSITTNQWLSTFQYTDEVIILSSMAGTILALYLTPICFWIALFFLSISIFIGSTLSFSYLNIIFPWFINIVSLTISGITFFSIKLSKQAKISKAYEIALSGLVSHHSLKKLIHNPQEISREASEQTLSIMFVDMVSFSTMAEIEHPKVVFKRLKEALGFFSEKVHEHGGVVDKTLGDGMLCFFGYHYIGGSTSKNHADQAISCALEIQKGYIEKSLLDVSDGKPLIPLRIGINSSRVYIGDLGNEHRIDFTLIGDGVNFAQRLETACEPFNILLSIETLNFSSLYDIQSPGMSSKKIYIKHQSEAIEVIEFQAFFEHKHLLEKAKQSFFKGYLHPGRAPRLPIEKEDLIFINTNFGKGKLINFSKSGFAILLEQKIALEQLIELEFHVSGKECEAMIKDQSFPTIVCEIKRSVKEGQKYIHGVKIINLNNDQISIVYEKLKSFTEKY